MTPTIHTFYLVRHAQSHSNAGGISQPNANISLSNKGHKQAQVLADHLTTHIPQPITRIYVSNYLRTQQTAQPLIEKIGIAAQTNANLHEFNFLPFSSIANVDGSGRLPIRQRYWQNADPHLELGEGTESFTTFAARVDSVLDNLHQQIIEKTFQNQETALLFTHGIWLAMLIWRLLGYGVTTPALMQQFHQFEQALSIQNCDIFQLTFVGNHRYIQQFSN